MISNILHDSRVSRLIELALLEDIGLGDLTSEATVTDAQLGKAEFMCKEDGVVAGLKSPHLYFSLRPQRDCPSRDSRRRARPARTDNREIDGSTKTILRASERRSTSCSV